ncbi:MAG: hypothetical protein R3Y35_06355 [Clostridia bacterium]
MLYIFMGKKRIFISSTGRTATQFFAQYLNLMIENSSSIHEPGTPWVSKPRRLLTQIKSYGLYHLTLGQNKNTHSMYKLSRDYVKGCISPQKACENILSINKKVDELYNTDVMVYSSGHIYGLLGLLDEVYDEANFVFIIRDPRDWIGSALNKMEYSLYGPVEFFLRELSLQPSCFDDDPYKDSWKKLSKFEKYCWFYNKLNTMVLETMKDKPNFKVFRYEDIFLSENCVENFGNLLEFSTQFKTGKINYTYKSELIGEKIDSKQKSKTWRNWTKEEAKIMMKHCGTLMNEYGYGKEEEWKKKIGIKKLNVKKKLVVT